MIIRGSGESHRGWPFSCSAAGCIVGEEAARLRSISPARWLDESVKGRRFGAAPALPLDESTSRRNQVGESMNCMRWEGRGGVQRARAAQQRAWAGPQKRLIGSRTDNAARGSSKLGIERSHSRQHSLWFFKTIPCITVFYPELDS